MYAIGRPIIMSSRKHTISMIREIDTSFTPYVKLIHPFRTHFCVLFF